MQESAESVLSVLFLEMAGSLHSHSTTRTQSLVASHGKMCVTPTQAHTVLHHGPLRPVKDGLRYEGAKNYLYLFRSSFLYVIYY